MSKENTIRYLASIGLDATKIAEDGWDERTYREFDGFSYDGLRKTVTRRWPDGFEIELLEEALAADCPGRQTNKDMMRYYLIVLRIKWGTMSPLRAKRLRKREPLLVEALEGILKYDRT